MTTEFPHPRYERKFVVQGLSLPEVIAIVRRHPSAFRETYPSRTVNNVYLDSKTLQAYYDHIHGIARRVKHRVRWYGPFDGEIGKPVLERKYKQGLVGGKAADALCAFEVNGQPLRSCLEAALEKSVLPDRLRESLRQLEPCLINRYRRHYFVSADGRFRLTVDSDLRFGKANGSHPRLTATASITPLTVIELKFELQHAEQATQVTNALPFSLTRCSKYVLGMQRI